MSNLRKFSLIFFVFSIAIISASCKGSTKGASDLKMAAMDDMPGEVKDAPTTVRQAYQFAVANPEILKQIPCYCGCDDIGHKSNFDCYVTGEDSNGSITYDTHALGCSICVDITQDTMRLLRQGQGVPEIIVYIDQTYSQYGPSNIP